MSPAASHPDDHHDIVVHLGDVIEERGMTLTELAERSGDSSGNLSILKYGRAKAMRVHDPHRHLPGARRQTRRPARTPIGAR